MKPDSKAKQEPVNLDEFLRDLKPLESAVEIGVFGFGEDGPVRPNHDAVCHLAQEHVHELLAINSDMNYLRHCEACGLDPGTGKAPKTERRRLSTVARIKREIAVLGQHYLDMLAVFEEAFGSDAAAGLDLFVKSQPSHQPIFPPSVQLELF